MRSCVRQARLPIFALCVISLAIRSIYACSTTSDPNNPGYDLVSATFEEGNWFFYGVGLLLIANIVLAFLVHKRYIFGIAFTLTALIVQPVILFFSIMDSCGIFYLNVMKGEFYGLSALVVAQFAFWVLRKSRRSLPMLSVK